MNKVKQLAAYMILTLTWLTRRSWWVNLVMWAEDQLED